jgi:hypothetical protein
MLTKVIINGDFWDNWFTTFDQFIQSEWSRLFPLLLSKNTIYIHGQHDPKSACNPKVRQFSQTNLNQYRLTIESLRLELVHGHTLADGRRSVLLNLYTDLIININQKSIRQPIFWLLHLFEIITIKILGPKFYFNNPFGNKSNQLMKNSPIRAAKSWLICGDSHMPEIDSAQKYANSGCILRGHASYLIIENGTPQLQICRY